MNRLARPLLAFAALTILAGSCVRPDSPTDVDGPVSFPLAINPALIPSPANGGAAPINRIRAIAVRVEDDVLVGETIVDVDPSAAEWVITLEVTASSEPTDVSVLVFLINVTNQVESTEFSGIAGPISVAAGETVEPADVELVRGSIDNLYVTGVAISAAPDTLYEGTSATLQATPTTSNDGTPSVFWTVLDSATLDVVDSTLTGLLPGDGRVVASAGAFDDTASVYVRAAPAAIDIDPDSVSVANPGDQATYTAVVLDARGDTLANEAVTWRSGTPQVIGSLGGGVFEGLSAGAGAVEAVSTSIPSLVGTAILLVEGGQPTDPSDMSVLIDADNMTPVDGDTIRVTVEAVNGTGQGAVDATNVQVRHVPALGFAILSDSPDQGTFDAQSGLWSVGTLNVGDTATLVLDLEVSVGSGGQSLPDSAWLAALDQADPDASNDTATVDLVISPRPVDVAVLKTVDEPQPLEGTQVNFTVSVVNNGDGPVSGLSVFDTLAGIFAGPAHAVSTGTLVNDSLWTIPLIAAGDTATWTTSATVGTGAAGGSATNTAVLRGLAQNDTTPSNDSATQVVDFPLSAVPVVTIIDPPDGSVYDPGDLVTFTGAANDPEEGDLTPTLAWTSSLDGSIGTGRTFSTNQLSTGVHVIGASATDTDGGTGTATIGITIALITTPATLNVPFGGTASLPITLTEGAPAGGLTVTVTSADPGIVQPTTSSVFIAEGALSANATLSGVQPGTAEVTVFNPQFGGSATSVTVLAELDVLQNSLRFPVPFPLPLDVQLEAAGVPTPAPSGGLTVNTSADDPTCVAVPSTMTIPGGLVSAQLDPAYGGSASLPCTTLVRVSAPSVAADSVQVTVDPAPGITVNSTTVGTGLQYGTFYAGLATSQHGGVTVRIESSAPGIMLIAPDAQTEGTPFIDVFLPNGSTSAGYWVQGVEGVTGTANIIASAPSFTTNGNATVDVVQTAFDIVSVPVTPTSFSPTDAFWVRVGVPNGQLTGMQIQQSVRSGGTALTATVTSSVPSVGEVITLTDSISPVSVDVVPGQPVSATSLAAGGVAFDPASAGSTTVSASIQGLIALPGATAVITVTQPGINLSSNVRVGSGLQWGTFYATLGGSQHGGVTVRIESANSQLLLIAPDQSTPGTPFIDVFVPDGQTQAPYWVQGVELATGSPGLSASAPGFATNSRTVSVEQPAVDLVNLNTSLTSFSPSDVFWPRVGVPNGQLTGMAIQQSIRAGGSPVTVTVTNFDGQVGELITLLDSVAPVTVQIATGSAISPTTVATGGVEFDPLNAGTTDVAVTIPDFVSLPLATRTVTVTAPTINVGSPTVGSGLQFGTLTASLGASGHGGVTVRIESSIPQTLLIAPDQSTPGTTFIDVPVADGATSAQFWVQGVEGATGQVPMTVSAPGFVTNSTATTTVVQPAIDILALSATQTTLSPDDPFIVRTGTPNGAQTFMSIEQSIRAGAAPLSVTVTSGTPAAGRLVTSSSQGPTAVVTVAAGTARTPITVATGGVAFDSQGEGITNVSASASGFLTVGSGSTDVSVTAPAITMNAITVGSGLIERPGNISLGASQHGGVTLRIESSNPSVMLVSSDAITAGAPFVDIVVPDGTTSIAYWIHGVEGQVGSVNVTASAAGFTDGSAAMSVVQPALDIQGLLLNRSTSDADDAFYARIGIPNANDTGLAAAQEVRPGVSPLTVNFTSSDPAAATLVTTSTSGGSLDVTIAVGAQNTPTSVAAGGVALDPLTAGSTTVTATINGFITTNPAGIRVVTITP